MAVTILSVEHRTTYRYAAPVRLNEHRLMCRPRDSHDLRLLETALNITPAATIRWLHDVLGNSIAIASFSEPATELVFESRFRAEHYPAKAQQMVVENYARHLPFNYSAEEIADLGRTTERHYQDPEHRVDLWAKRLVQRIAQQDTLRVLALMAETIKRDFSYARREEMGTQTPVETLERGAGSCRDFALLMMEAARSLGLAARFVSGYLYDDKLIGASGGVVGGGSTHAWAQIYLPGAGWIEIDPTNALIGGRNLIRVAVARDAALAVPIAGSFVGSPTDFIDMEVQVVVKVA